VAWMTKTQVAPFLVASFAGTMLLMSLRGDWSVVGRLAVCHDRLMGVGAGFFCMPRIGCWQATSCRIRP
jgi:hypothetical protein